ncbi:DB module [Ancylostoma ceylanicum]|uniref:DB module n=1 Tax=Ancylostoma ceylanicum TaxID=53326 RepID=A0A0D6LRY2_9BILA|nr:DB module [Ancylostoma ceylanicum]
MGSAAILPVSTAIPTSATSSGEFIHLNANYQQNFAFPPQQQQQRFPLPQYQQQVPPPPQQFVPTLQQFQQQQAVFKPRPVYREGPKIYEQQFKINKAVPVEGFMPQLVEPQLPIQQRSLPEGAYGAEERLIDGNHPSYIEDTAKTTPVDQFRKFVQPQVVIPKPAPRRPSVPRPQPPVRVVATTRPTPVIVKTQPAAIVPKSIATSNGGKKDANAVFLGCCKTAKVAKSCERICNFDILNKKVLTGMFLGTDPCPQSYGLELLQCAAQSDDHTACCRSKGVHTTSAGDKCLGFCNMRPGVTFQLYLALLCCGIEALILLQPVLRTAK